MADTGKKKRMTRAQRKRTVEEALKTRGWNGEIVADLVEQTGASERTIYRDRDEVLDELADRDHAHLPRRRAAFLVELRRVRGRAESSRAWPAVARLLDMESRVSGVDRVPLPDVEVDAEAEVDTTLESLLRQTRRMRKQAQQGHSYVAAARLLGDERELVAEINRQQEEQRQRELASMDDGEKLANLVSVLGNLPEELRAQLAVSLADSVGARVER